MKRLVSPSLVLAVCLMGLGAPSSASAQIYSGNPSTIPWPAGLPGNTNTRGTSAAHDPASGNFLVVGANGGWGVSGVIVNIDGVPLSGGFQISTQPGHVNYVRAAYGAQVAGQGGFLVAWVAEDGNQIHIHTRMVSTGGGLIGGENIITDAANQAFLEGGPAIAYSPTSNRFLVAWQGGGSTQGLKARFVALDGTGFGGIETLASGWQRDPGVAWNPFRDEFGISVSGENGLINQCNNAIAIAPASNLAAFRRTTFNTVACPGVMTTMTDVTYSTLTNRYVMASFELTAISRARISVFDDNGSLQSSNIISASLGSYDSLALAFNPVSKTILLVGLTPGTDDIRGLELNGYGSATSGELTFAPGERGWLARVAPSQTAARWLATYQDVAGPNNNISDPSILPVATTSSNGGSGGPAPTDSDGDGIPDSQDSCPSQFGTLPNGCPVAPPPPPPPPTDTDGDGKPDSVDGCPTVFALTANGCPATAPPSGDFNMDGLSELVFTNMQTGQAIAWKMNGISLVSSHWLWDDATTPGWKIVGTGDLTGDGKPDLLWQHETTGDVRLFKMDLFNRVGVQTNGLNVADKNWRIKATGDFNNDGRLDIVWQNQATSHVVIWFMEYVGDQARMFASYFATLPGAPTVPIAPGVGWEVVGSADIDGDGYRDLVWQYPDGSVSVWRMQGATILQSLSVGQVNPNWRLRAVANYGWDGREDVIFQHAVTGDLYIWLRSGNGFVPFAYLVPKQVNPVWRVSGPR